MNPASLYDAETVFVEYFTTLSSGARLRGPRQTNGGTVRCTSVRGYQLQKHRDTIGATIDRDIDDFAIALDPVGSR